MKFILKIIPHKKQRLGNGDVADYYEKDGDIIIAVSDTGNDYYNLLIWIHELVELFLIRKAGIPIKVIDEWDCKHPDEMGDHPFAPYKKQHSKATAIEMFSAKQLGIDWNKYDKAIEALSLTTPPKRRLGKEKKCLSTLKRAI